MLTNLALGRGSLDRCAERRGDAEWMRAAIDDPATRIIGVSGGEVVVEIGDGTESIPPAQVDRALRATASGQRSATPTGVRLADVRAFLAEARDVYLIGIAAGRLHLAASFEVAPEGARSLREIGTALTDDEAACATAAVALDQWHRLHTHCPRCGEPTRSAMSGWERRCPDDATSHFPRTDPAVIVVITDADDRLLLARQGTWPERRFSLVAGYVEPGETAEQAVGREVLEEVGIRVDNLEFLGSQPWPFPASLMLCYHARAIDTNIRVDGVEIVEAGWWSRESFAADVASGALLLPSGVSIARRAVEEWFGHPLRDA